MVITMKKITSFYQNRTSFYLLEMFCKFCDIIGGIARGAFMEQNITKGKGTAAVKLVFQLTPAYDQTLENRKEITLAFHNSKPYDIEQNNLGGGV